MRLYGRERELDVLDDLIRRSGDHRGGALVIKGERGAGKSALLAAAAQRAAAHGVRVLSASGVQSETPIAFAGLHSLLQPVLPLADDLPPRQRSALHGTFGTAPETDADLLLTGLATLSLISAGQPTGVVIDDAHWLDPPTVTVLGFVARRLAGKSSHLIAATDDGLLNPLDGAGLPDLRLGNLNEDAAGALLDRQAPELEPELRERLIEEAAGNPLALVELPAAFPPARGRARKTPPPGRMPLTERLEQAFTGRLAGLPASTRWLLLVAAAADGAVLAELLSATSLATGSVVTMEALSPAVGIGVIELSRPRLRFTHPLLRSAIYQAATQAQRQAAHTALAEVLAGQPDRQVWHLAEATVGPDEQVAAALDLAATRAEQRGAAHLAATAIERAAELGDHGLRRTSTATGWQPEASVGSLLATADRLRADGHPRLAAESLHAAALRCWCGRTAKPAASAVLAAVRDIGLPLSEPARLATLALADPVGSGKAVTEAISGLSPEAADPAGMYLIGSAAAAVWAYDLAIDFLGVAVSGLRAGPSADLLAQALVAQAWAAVHLARGRLALSAAREVAAVASEPGQQHYAVGAKLAQAAVIAERGDLESAEAITKDAEALLPAHASHLLAVAQFVRGRGAVASQRHAEGAGHLRRILDPADQAYHPFIGCWGLADLVEATAQTGEIDAARTYLADLESLATITSAPLLRAQTGYARPIVAADREAEPLFLAAIDRDLAAWPGFRARTQLRYGRWLRRQRRVAQSRVPLRTARDSFDALNYPRLADCARQELRASGEARRPTTLRTWDQLTPREVQIAKMAADGFSNREIGRELYISHRTVGYHLHRIFPKLGITSRSQLHAAVLNLA
jgi:DNA-binding CsgD family transcriptional regulator